MGRVKVVDSVEYREHQYNVCISPFKIVSVLPHSHVYTAQVQ